MTTTARTLPVAGLLLATAALGLTGCGSKDTTTSPATSSSSAPTASSTPSDAAASSTPSDAAASSTPSDAAASTTPSATTPAASASAAASAPAGMKLVTGTGYTVAVPEAWQKGRVAAKPSATTIGDLNYGVQKGTSLIPSMNVQLYTQSATVADLPDIRRGELSALVKSGGKEVLELDGTVDGDQAVGAAGLMTVAGQPIRMRQLVTIHGGKVYAISLVLPSSSSNAQAKTQMDQILSTWKWTA